MDCSAFDDLIEPLAAGEIAQTEEMRAHLASCAGCRQALARATELDRMLRSQAAPTVAPAFVASVMARVRRERWRAEQMLDVAFNAAVALAVVTGVGGLYALLTITGMAGVTADLVRLFVGATEQMVVRAAPQAWIYALTTGALVAGLAAWWWADRGLEF
jgi:predicted anti-sigma-YlaC factor YlaD